MRNLHCSAASEERCSRDDCTCAVLIVFLVLGSMVVPPGCACWSSSQDLRNTGVRSHSSEAGSAQNPRDFSPQLPVRGEIRPCGCTTANGVGRMDSSSASQRTMCMSCHGIAYVHILVTTTVFVYCLPKLMYRTRLFNPTLRQANIPRSPNEGTLYYERDGSFISTVPIMRPKSAAS